MSKLSVLVIGSGGREHALAWALSRSPHVGQIYVAPGNAGTEWPAGDNCAGATSIAIPADDDRGLLSFAKEQHIGLTVVGPEIPLAAGIVDKFQSAGLCIFGPSRVAAQLESSKAFAKTFMRDLSIPTADYAVFEDVEAAQRYLATINRPVVVKADGLAAGKGVIICQDRDQAIEATRYILKDRAFGDAGNSVVIEEMLTGPELSVLAFSDGKTIVPMPPVRDHKRIHDGDVGPNTGGMGAYAPVPEISPALMEDIRRTILEPAIDGMIAVGAPYVGVLYAGLMLTPDGPKVLEFNARFGDPETQAILPLLETDLVEIMLACIEGRLDQIEIRWKPETCATVVLASSGYPDSYPKGLPITGLDRLASEKGCHVFHAGTAKKGNQIVTAGGRVLAVSGLGPDLPAALAKAYQGIESINFDGMHYRRDIGHGSLKVKHGAK